MFLTSIQGAYELLNGDKGGNNLVFLLICPDVDRREGKVKIESF